MNENESRNVRLAFFQALKDTGLTAKDISETSGIGNSIISNFKNKGSLHYKTLQRLLDALPEQTYLKFVELLHPPESGHQSIEKSDNQIVLSLRQAALQYAKNRQIEGNEFKVESNRKSEQRK